MSRLSSPLAALAGAGILTGLVRPTLAGAEWGVPAVVLVGAVVLTWLLALGVVLGAVGAWRRDRLHARRLRGLVALRDRPRDIDSVRPLGGRGPRGSG